MDLLTLDYLVFFHALRSYWHHYLFVSSPEISSEDTGHLCQSVLQDFSSVLSVDPASSSASKPSLENGIASQENGGMEHDVTDDMDSVISSSLMVKLVVMAIATVTRLQSRGKLRAVLWVKCLWNVFSHRNKYQRNPVSETELYPQFRPEVAKRHDISSFWLRCAGVIIVGVSRSTRNNYYSRCFFECFKNGTYNSSDCFGLCNKSMQYKSTRRRS